MTSKCNNLVLSILGNPLLMEFNFRLPISSPYIPRIKFYDKVFVFYQNEVMKSSENRDLARLAKLRSIYGKYKISKREKRFLTHMIRHKLKEGKNDK